MAIALLSVVLTACGSTAQTLAPSPLATPRTSTPATAQPSYTPDAFTALVQAATGGLTPAGSDLDRLWADVFSAINVQGAKPYEAPAAVLGYRSGDVPDTACAGRAGPTAWIGNARYCPADHKILYDEDWLRRIAERNGDFTTLAILAHEWAHHVQWLIGGEAQDIGWELQADCLAGMYLTTSAHVPHTGVEDEDAAMKAALTTMFSLGDPDYTESEWFRAFAHGSPPQRIMAVSTGLQSNQEVVSQTGSMAAGLPFCYGYRDFEPGKVTMIGPYRFLQPPGHEISTSGDTVAVEPETRTDQPGSLLQMRWMPTLPLPGGATEEQFTAVIGMEIPGARTIGKTFPIRASLEHGLGVGQYYERLMSAADGSSSAESGLFALVSADSTKGGLRIKVVRPEPAPTEPLTAAGWAVLEEEIVTLYQAVNRLCTPDESSDPSARNLDVSCLHEQ